MKTLTPIGKFEMLAINGYVDRINKETKDTFIKVSYYKVVNEICKTSAVFTLYNKTSIQSSAEESVAFLDGIYIWASDTEK